MLGPLSKSLNITSDYPIIMEDIGKIIGGFFALLMGIYILSEVAKALPTPIGGLQFGPLLLALFIIYAIAWVLKEVLGK